MGFFANFLCLLYIFFSKFLDVVLVRGTIAMVTDHNQNEHGEERVYWAYISWIAVHLRKPRQEFKSCRNLKADLIQRPRRRATY